MSFELIERDWTREKLKDVELALARHPSTKSYILDEVSLLDLINMSEVANCDVELKFVPRGPKNREEAVSYL